MCHPFYILDFKGNGDRYPTYFVVRLRFLHRQQADISILIFPLPTIHKDLTIRTPLGLLQATTNIALCIRREAKDWVSAVLLVAGRWSQDWPGYFGTSCRQSHATASSFVLTVWHCCFSTGSYKYNRFIFSFLLVNYPAFLNILHATARYTKYFHNRHNTG